MAEDRMLEIPTKNYFRSATAAFQTTVSTLNKKEFGGYSNMLQNFVSKGALAVKFLLPYGIKILDGQTGVIGVSDLHLPFENVILEFINDDGIPTIVLASQSKQQGVLVTVAMFDKRRDSWLLIPIGTGLYNVGNDLVFDAASVAVPWSDTRALQGRLSEYARHLATYVTYFIEALSCGNVGSKAIAVRKLNKSSKKSGALPFDEYRVLTVQIGKKKAVDASLYVIGQCDRRQPREHLRRGCIYHRFGKKWWRQSTVVNAGSAGKIHKDYSLKPVYHQDRGA